MSDKPKIGKREAWEIGLSAEHVRLVGRQVWTVDLDDSATELKHQGELADDITEEEFWEECREGLSK